MEKPFEELTTEEMVELSEEDIQNYMTAGLTEEYILAEIDNCKKIIKSLK